ncbi:glycosyltransferase family 39 protein [Gimesia aquarii]|uniref:Dolichyl-phosphate-mannose-protein mannosyltransferase n=1 Tax=Gimesia aquarii TaxID=2527964 RepID=A0A517VQS0_9PLAN|nr:glycosyltransferase family 39 protein [Gimesia aquarii]QDT95333.1 Dolichyl-phosphate-mannose-protein mannosyltransferase [Gimesia aquarii]
MPQIEIKELESTPITRLEFITVVILFLLGGSFRCLFLSETAIEHFDEGVYASNLWFTPEQGAEYPGRYFYAPPLLPFLIEWSMVFLGSGSWGTFLPSLLSGILTVPLAWWVARNWFGPAAGLVALTLAGLSDLHLVYSRAALTDVTLGFFLLLSVYLIWKSYLSRDWKWPVLAGLTIGAGWATKYNGWLPLAVGLSGMLPWLFIYRRQLDSKTSCFLRWSVIACIAFLVWLPVLMGLQKWGGYSVVAANHSRYVVGFSGWLDSFSRQVDNHKLLEGTPGYIGIGLVCLVLCLLLHMLKVQRQLVLNARSQTDRSTWNVIIVGVLAALPLIAVYVLGVSPTLAVLGFLGIFLQLLFASKHTGQKQSETDELDSESLKRSLAAWLLAAWFCGLFLTTPLYYPYPRLTIPWTISAWLGTAALAGWIEQRSRSSLFSFLSDKEKKRFSFIPAISVIMILIITLCIMPWSVVAWQPRNGLAKVSQNVLTDIRAETGAGVSDSILYIYAEPGLFFNLKAQGHSLTGPVADFEFLNSLPNSMPVYLLTGPHAAADADFQKKFQQVRDHFELVKSYDYSPSLLVRLNQAHLNNETEIEPIILYRAK